MQNSAQNDQPEGYGCEQPLPDTMRGRARPNWALTFSTSHLLPLLCLMGFISVATLAALYSADPAERTQPIVQWAVVAEIALALCIFLVHVGAMWRQSFFNRTYWPAQGPEEIESLPFGLGIWSPDGRLISCNSRFMQMTGATDDTPYAVLIRNLSQNCDCSTLCDGRSRRLIKMTTPDGRALLLDEQPAAEGGFVMLVSDITMQTDARQALQVVKQNQQQLGRELLEEKFRAEAASRAKTAFLAHLSHDVRTPLNHIIGFADLIAHETYGALGDRRYLNYIRDIKRSGEKLLASFSEILEFSQLESGQLALKREHIDVTELLNSITNRFSAKAARANLAFDISKPEDLFMTGDRICLERMLGNIVENAIRFTPNGGHIYLQAWRAEDGVVLEISDTGIGMTEQRLKEISEPFALGDAAFARDNGGTGLGIAIARSIAELSGGMLVIDSSPAVGTTVMIALPLEPAREGQIARAA